MSWESQAISLLSASLVRPVIVATAAGLAIRLFRVRHPASRHAIWAAVLAALFLLPVVSVFAPHWDVPLLPGKQVPAAIVQSPPIFAVETEQPVQIVEAPVAASRTVSARSKFTMPLVLWIYFAGLLAMTLYHVTGWVLLRRLIGKSKTLRGGVLRESEDVAAPVAVGVLRPAVILPPGWGEWNRETRQAVLAHEFAHLRRGDTRVAALARVVKTVMWFHPLAWWVAKHVMELAEQACDAAGLKRAGDPAGYSRVLLAFGSGVNRAGYRVGLPGLAMAGSASGMAKRIDGIFELADGKLRKLARPGLVLGLVGLPVMCAAATLGFTASKILVLPAMSPKAPEAPELNIAAQVRTQTAPVVEAAPAVDHNLTFEVATIKPPDPGARGYTIRGGPANRGGQSDPGQIEYVNHSLQQLLLAAYGIQPFELAGPSWLENVRFDVTAKLPPGTTAEQIPAMLQNLLSERFHISAHRETREQRIYVLTLAKGGAKLKDSTASESPQLTDGGLLKSDRNGFAIPVAGRVMSSSWGGNLLITAGSQDSSQIAKMLSKYLTAPVIDRTGLTSKYDFTLEFAEENPPPESLSNPREPAAALPTAVQEQLGLKLEKGRGPVGVLVIDRIDKTPVEN